LFEYALRVIPRPADVLPVMILVTVTVTPLYWGDRYGHHDHDDAPAPRMRQKTGLHPRPGRVPHPCGPAHGLPTSSRLLNSYVGFG
jgi:hypothetical protein